MALLSYIRGAVDGAGKSLATIRIALTGALSSDGADLAHVEITQEGDADDDQLYKRHVAAGTLQAVPTGAAVDVVAALCKLRSVFLSNTHATAVRAVTLQDKTGTPIKILDALSLAPGQVLYFEVGDMKCTGGLQWTASGTGVVGAVRAYTA